MPGSVRTLATFMLIWLVAGAGTVAASILGSALGKFWLFAGAVIGGIFAAAFAVWLSVRFGWIAPREYRPARAGAVLGFLVAMPIAALNLDGPVIPVLATALTGIGALVGTQVARDR